MYKRKKPIRNQHATNPSPSSLTRTSFLYLASPQPPPPPTPYSSADGYPLSSIPCGGGHSCSLIVLARVIGLRSILVFVKTNNETHNETDDDEDNDTDPEAPPFHPSGTTSTGNTLVKLSITGFSVLLDVLGVLLGLLNHGLLNDDSFGEILEELVELDKSTLDLLNVVVTGTNSSKDGRSGCCAVCLELS